MEYEATREKTPAAEIVLAATKAKVATELETAAATHENSPGDVAPKRAIDARAQDTILRAR